MERHNLLVSALDRACRRKGYETLREQRIATARGMRVPDLLVYVPSKFPEVEPSRVWVVDPSIVVDNCQDLNEEHMKNVNKYCVHPKILE